jgi:hypothetical protein
MVPSTSGWMLIKSDCENVQCMVLTIPEFVEKSLQISGAYLDSSQSRVWYVNEIKITEWSCIPKAYIVSLTCGRTITERRAFSPLGGLSACSPRPL